VFCSGRTTRVTNRPNELRGCSRPRPGGRGARGRNFSVWRTGARGAEGFSIEIISDLFSVRATFYASPAERATRGFSKKSVSSFRQRPQGKTFGDGREFASPRDSPSAERVFKDLAYRRHE